MLLFVASRPSPGEGRAVLLGNIASDVLLCELAPNDEAEALLPMMLESLANEERVARLFMYALLCSRWRLLATEELCARCAARLHLVSTLEMHTL